MGGSCIREAPAHEAVEVVVETEEEAEERTKRNKRLHARTQQTPVDGIVAAAVCAGEAIDRCEKTERKEVLEAVKKKKSCGMPATGPPSQQSCSTTKPL
jgi:hypothetical protein